MRVFFGVGYGCAENLFLQFWRNTFRRHNEPSRKGQNTTTFRFIVCRISLAEIPDFDILLGGFPCQAFSIAGYRRGFNDTRGTLFFDVATILRDHRPKAFFLENVKNLKSHDGGRTYDVIENTLKELGYVVHSQVLNSMTHANIPQNRERIFIVGFDPAQVRRHDELRFPDKMELTRL